MPSLGQKPNLQLYPVRHYRDALDLFQKEKYGAAFQRFNDAIRAENDPKSELSVSCQYHAALCALQLFNRDSEYLLTKFVKEYPESPFVKKAFFQLGRYNYRKRKYPKVISWMERIDVYDLTQDELPEYYFELGYSYFQEKQYKESARLLYEIKDVDNPYQSPARYYYSHILYEEGKMETALKGFNQLLDHPTFGPVVPYYIAQIYFTQGKNKDLIEFATPLLDSVVPKREAEIAHLLGQAHYRLGNFEKAIPYLEKYREKGARASREDNYALGYAYYKSKQYENALILFGRVYSLEEDSLAQITLYHMGDCYVKTGERTKAITVFDQAYELEIDPKITEDALFNYAKLSYEAAYDPYNKAIKAFKEFLFRYPESPKVEEVTTYLLNVFLTSKDYDQALSSIESISNPNARLQEAYQIVAFNQGVEQFHSQRYESAVNSFRNSRKYVIDKQLQAQSYYWEAEAAFKRRNYKEAVSLYQEFYYSPGAILLPQFNRANYNIAYGYYYLEDYAESIKWFRKFTQYSQENNAEYLADAHLRIGDLFYLQRDYKGAAEYYDRAIKEGDQDLDYAYFQRGITQGILKDVAGKQASMLAVINQFPTSKYVDDATYHLAVSADKNDQNELALAQYSNLINQFPESEFVRRSMINLGYIHFRQNQLQKAYDAFNSVVDRYSSYADRKEALEGLERYFTAIDDPLAFRDYLQGKSLTVPEGRLDSNAFLTYQKAYQEGRWENSIANFESYLESFDNPIFALEAHFYKGELLFQDRYYDKALKDYMFVINQEPGIYSVVALEKASYIEFNATNYKEALPLFTRLEKEANDNALVSTAELGVMRCQYELKNYEQALIYCERILQRNERDQALDAEALYKKGKSAFALGKTDKAWDAFSIAADTLPNAWGAESKYHIALILYGQDKFAESEEEIHELVGEFGGYHFWVAKGLILLSDVYVSIGDVFQAMATLQSILDNYEGDPNLIEEARKKLDVLIEATKEPEPEEEPDLEVEFNDSDEFDIDALFEEEVIDEEDDLNDSSQSP